ncbi:glutathione S-transferase family protein [Bradyrhizobium sp. ARR65]|uniref:glutathione S-transferase family protein n=1 Tax=Bradyrhizobium sp. ARR65 TaxID=1040989 RepID=UPI0004632AE1|nr:glutathione S-transferase family protein [Bradyrhizobium sp. ARR65]
MGELIDGRWRPTTPEASLLSGTVERKRSIFRSWLTADGAPVDGKPSFPAWAGRYHLYVSLACPWAHRTLIMRSLKGLEHLVSVSVVHWLMGEDGWTFAAGPGVVPDEVNRVSKLHELYTLADPHCTSKVTVPVLWDKFERTIVSNESSEIIRMFNTAFDKLGALPGDYFPAEHWEEIERVNERVYANLNIGVYRAGFAKQADVYEAAAYKVFETLDWLEARLADRSYLVGGRLTEADIRLFTTLIRFDSVYYGHFKCNLRRLVDYPRLWDYTRRLFQHPKIRPTLNMAHIKAHYFGSHPRLNPSGIVPIGPVLDLDEPVLSLNS